jgi:hypothetical protein
MADRICSLLKFRLLKVYEEERVTWRAVVLRSLKQALFNLCRSGAPVVLFGEE